MPKIDKQASEFEYKGTKYEAIESPDGKCSMKCLGWNLYSCNKLPFCSAGIREDKRDVFFVQVVEYYEL